MFPNCHTTETQPTQRTFTLCGDMIVARHLILQEMSLRPSGEWTPTGGWTVVRVAEGAGYCLQTGSAREMNTGDMAVVGPNTTVVFRASQLGLLKLQYFHVLPQCLNGLLTVTEWRQLEDPASETTARLQYYAASDASAQKFARLAAQSQRDGLAARSAFLQLWAASVTALLPAVGAAAVANSLRERFRQFVGKMSEAELAVRSLSQLAGELHCSERHFSRLFREEFHISLRARQSELRLQRARQLLAESDAKIINVAYESGYRHLGLFNAMFKRRFGVTPSQWRHQNAPETPPAGKRSGGLATAWLLIAQFFLAATLFAQPAKQATREASPAGGSSTNAGPRFTVRKYLVTGNTVLAPGQIGQALTNVPAAFGTNVGFSDIKSELAELQMAYRERGYVTVSVGLPQQRLTNAEVRIKVTEGRLTDIKVEGNKWFSTPNVLRSLPSLHTNILLNSHVFQRELDDANNNRDRQIYPSIGPGPEPGTTELTLKVKDRLPLHSRVEFNNVSTPGTPEDRMVVNAEYDNLWQLEHQVGASYTFSPMDYHTRADFYDTPLDLPLMANYSVYYRLPLSSQSSIQEKIDQSDGRFGYNEVTHQFELPPSSSRPELSVYASRALSDTGIQVTGQTNVLSTPLLTVDKYQPGQNFTLNENVGARVSWPLPQAGNVASTLTMGVDLKFYAQASYNTNSYLATTLITNNGTVTPITAPISTGQNPVYSRIFYVPLNIGLNGSMPDPLGTTYFNAQANFNLTTFAGRSASQGTNTVISRGGLSEVSNGRVVRDQYITAQLGADRVQRVYKDWTVKLHADGQWANGALFSNEQLAMGGAAGVRGYQDGTAYGDTGWRVSVEPQTPMVQIGDVDGNIPAYVRSSIFVDYGQIYALGTLPTGAPDELDFLGAGWAITLNIGSHLDARFTMAFPLLDPAQSDPRPIAEKVRFYFGVGAQF